MRWSPATGFPKDWYTDVEVLRGGGRDSMGNPKQPEVIPLDECLISNHSMTDTTEPASDQTTNPAYLYRKPGFKFLPTDRIRVPETSDMEGTWEIIGRPAGGPMGWEVRLSQ